LEGPTQRTPHANCKYRQKSISDLAKKCAAFQRRFADVLGSRKRSTMENVQRRRSGDFVVSEIELQTKSRTLSEHSTPPLRLTVFGSGTAMGVPKLCCRCRVCRSDDPHDKRTRASLLLSRAGRNIVIDTTPDFRMQALRAGLNRLDAVVFTHGHADHILGFDDLGPLTMLLDSLLPVYGSAETLAILRRTFAYVFDNTPTDRTIPQVSLHAIDGPFDLFGTQFIPVPALHGDMEVLGFRFGRAAYLTDFHSISEPSKALLVGLDDLIVEALREKPHPKHQTLEQALALVSELRPRRAWFTHLGHKLPQEETNRQLRSRGFPHVQLAYDGLSFEVRQ